MSEADYKRLRTIVKTMSVNRLTVRDYRLMLDEIDALRPQVQGHCDRIAAQSELLSNKAEVAGRKSK